MAAAQVIRFIVTFILMGIILMQSLQNSNGALREKEIETDEDDHQTQDNLLTVNNPVWLSYWVYCVSSTGPVIMSNRDLRIFENTDGGLCIGFDSDLKSANGTKAVDDNDMLVACRAMSITGLICTFLVGLFVELGGQNKCMLCIAAIFTVLDLCVQIVLVSVQMAYYGKYKERYSLEWPWYMSFVALGLLLILTIMLCCLCKKAGKGKCCEGGCGGGEKKENKRGNCFRWVYVILFLPAIVFQFLIHCPEGARDHKDSDGNYRSHLGLWRLCLDEKTDVSWGLRYVKSEDMCVAVDGYLPSHWVDYTLLLVAMITIFIAHGTTISAMTLAIIAVAPEDPKKRMCLFIVRTINICIAAIAITIACSCTAAAVPDGWSMGYAFGLPWVSFAVIWILCILTIVQVACKKNLFGEMPEAEKQKDAKKGETRKLNEPKPEDKKSEPKKPSTSSEPTKDERAKKEEEARRAQEEEAKRLEREEEERRNRSAAARQDEPSPATMTAPPPYTEKDSAANANKRDSAPDVNSESAYGPERAPPSESEKDPMEATTFKGN